MVSDKMFVKQGHRERPERRALQDLGLLEQQVLRDFQADKEQQDIQVNIAARRFL